MNKPMYMSLVWGMMLLISMQSVVLAEEKKPPTESMQASPTTAPEANVLKVGILAKLGTEEGMKMWTALGEYLTKKVPPYTFEIVPLAFSEIHLAVRRRTVDFILTNPKFYIELESLYGLGRIATLNNKLTQGRTHSMFGGVVFTKSSRNDIRNYQDLKSKSFMAVDKLSFGGWQVALCELRHYQIDPSKYFSNISFGGTHEAVVYAVRDGTVDAGTVRTDTLERMAAEGKIKLEDFFILNARQYDNFPLFLSTELYPEWSFARTQRVSDKLATQVSIALMQLTPDEPAAIVSKSAGWVVPHNYQKVEECLKELSSENDSHLIGGIKLNNLAPDNVILSYWCWIVLALLVFILGIMIIMRD
jgi:ABC-type phosphate/phosphonate transport system substrate-binding protein